MKEALFIIMFILFGSIILGTAFLPVILSLVLGSWWYMALYFVIWGVVAFEVILAIGAFGIAKEMRWI